MPPINPGITRGGVEGLESSRAGCLHSQEWKKPWKTWMLPGTAVAGGLETRDLQVEALPGWSCFDIPCSCVRSSSQLIWDQLKFGFYEPAFVGLWQERWAHQ